jgi:hypothetical protein
VQIALPKEGLEGYKSNSQRARVATELWAQQNLYCANCECTSLHQAPANMPAVDLDCLTCGACFQLKAQSHPFSRRIVDAAYSAMVRAIRENRTPNLFALQYDLCAVSSEERTGTILALMSHDTTRHSSPNNRQIQSGFGEVVPPFLPCSAQNIGCDVTYSKQSIRKFLPGATTTCGVAQFFTEFRIAPDAQRKKESASRDASEQGKIPLNAQKEKEPL